MIWRSTNIPTYLKTRIKALEEVFAIWSNSQIPILSIASIVKAHDQYATDICQNSLLKHLESFQIIDRTARFGGQKHMTWQSSTSTSQDPKSGSWQSAQFFWSNGQLLVIFSRCQGTVEDSLSPTLGHTLYTYSLTSIAIQTLYRHLLQ